MPTEKFSKEIEDFLEFGDEYVDIVTRAPYYNRTPLELLIRQEDNELKKQDQTQKDKDVLTSKHCHKKSQVGHHKFSSTHAPTHKYGINSLFYDGFGAEMKDLKQEQDEDHYSEIRDVIRVSTDKNLHTTIYVKRRTFHLNGEGVKSSVYAITIDDTPREEEKKKPDQNSPKPDVKGQEEDSNPVTHKHAADSKKDNEPSEAELLFDQD